MASRMAGEAIPCWAQMGGVGVVVGKVGEVVVVTVDPEGSVVVEAVVVVVVVVVVGASPQISLLWMSLAS